MSRLHENLIWLVSLSTLFAVLDVLVAWSGNDLTWYLLPPSFAIFVGFPLLWIGARLTDGTWRGLWDRLNADLPYRQFPKARIVK